MGAISTRNGRVMIGATSSTTAVLAARWSVEFTSDEVDVTNFEGGGFAEWIPSHVDAKVSFDGFYDLSADPFNSASPGLVAGTIIACRLYMRRTGNLNFYFPKLSLFNVNVEAGVRDAVRYSVMGKNLGQFLYTNNFSFSGMDYDRSLFGA